MPAIQPIRYASWPPRLAQAVLLALLLAIGLGLALDVESVIEGDEDARMLKADRGDVALYRAVITRMQAGEGFYAANGVEQAARGYPTTPFVTWRLPTAATLIAMLGEQRAGMLLQALAVFTVLFWIWVLLRAGLQRWTVLAASLLLGTGVIIALPMPAPSLYLHEVWASVLIALSLGLRQSAWPLAVLSGLAALAFRELALPFVAVMGVCALLEGRRREALGWGAAILVFALYLAVHAWQVSAHLGPDPNTSAGWLVFGGWRFVLETAQWNVVALILGPWLVVIAMPLAVLGAGAWRHPLGTRLGVTVAVYTLGFMIAGRPDNTYWGVLCAPLVAVSLTFAPAGLRALWKAARGRG
ncbi:hypothetical protein [Halochromatium salexigens]|uniref:hypothetical protein n=1 Tax=Halochromatium salexigens TaxID=49447 RepID=UPI00191268B7|nr:hypothetical protein [Halochromatium salexigens]